MNKLYEYEKYKEVIIKSNLFDSIPECEVEGLLEFLDGKVKCFKKGENIINLEDSVPYSGMVLNGTLEISFLNEHFDKISINYITESSLFGESLACFGTKSSPVQLGALTNCCVLFLDLNKLFQVNHLDCQYKEQLLINFTKILSSEHLFLSQKIRILSQKVLRDRLNIYFNSLKHDGNNIIHLPFSKTAFAEFLGVNRSALSRELSKMQNEHLIEVNGKSIRVIES